MTIGTRVRQLTPVSAALNYTRRKVNTLRQDKGGLVFVGNTVSGVNSTNSFDDSGSGLPVFAVGQLVEVSGLALNSRRYRVVTSTAASLVVSGGTVQDEGAGAVVYIRSV